jgi:hypothetical protein
VTHRAIVQRFAAYVVTRSGIVHDTRCKVLAQSRLHCVRAVNIDAPPAGSRPCKLCNPKPAPRLVALKRFRYAKRDIEAGELFAAVSEADAAILCAAKLADVEARP